MGSANYPGVYGIPTFPNNGLPAPGGVLHFPPQTVGEMQQPEGGSVPGLGSSAIGALLGALAALGASHVLQQHFAGSNTDATPKSIDPNYRALTRRPSPLPGSNGDQPLTADSAEVAARPASSDTAAGVTEGNPTANFAGEGLEAKAHDPNNRKVRSIPDAPPVVPAEGEPPLSPECEEQWKEEQEACKQAEGWNWKGKYSDATYRPRGVRKWTAEDCARSRVSAACGGGKLSLPGDKNSRGPGRSR